MYTYTYLHFFQGGLYILHMIDTYVGSELLGWTAVCEAIALSLCYGES